VTLIGVGVLLGWLLAFYALVVGGILKRLGGCLPVHLDHASRRQVMLLVILFYPDAAPVRGLLSLLGSQEFVKLGSHSRVVSTQIRKPRTLF
jgi:hypothetical protein